jgi:hypothetical protein
VIFKFVVSIQIGIFFAAGLGSENRGWLCLSQLEGWHTAGVDVSTKKILIIRKNEEE